VSPKADATADDFVFDPFPLETEESGPEFTFEPPNEAVFSKPVDLGTYLAEGENGENTCPTRSSVLGLAVTCALMVVLYVCSIFCFCMRRAVANSGSKSGRDYLR
jgi:hypothetical protein